MRKNWCVFILIVLVLTGCGKSELAKRQETVADKENDIQIEAEQVDTYENVEAADGTKKNDTEESDVNMKKGSGIKIELSNPAVTSTKKSATEQEIAPKSTQKSSEDSMITQNSKDSLESIKKPVESIVEEVAKEEVVFKYGLIKYDKERNEYMVYSDGSKELLNSITYTCYNKENYRASNEELQAESNSNVNQHMSYYQEVLRMVNEIRAEVGVAPLTLDVTLCKAASMRAIEMDYSDYFIHERPSGEPFWNVLQYYNVMYSTCGENIAAGQTTPQKVVNSWKSSSGHYQNMVNPSYTKLGVGYSGTGVGNYGHYWCQLFTN